MYILEKREQSLFIDDSCRNVITSSSNSKRFMRLVNASMSKAMICCSIMCSISVQLRLFLCVFFISNRRDFENELIKKLNPKKFLEHFFKVNDVSALRYAIIKLKSEECEVNI